MALAATHTPSYLRVIDDAWMQGALGPAVRCVSVKSQVSGANEPFPCPRRKNKADTKFFGKMKHCRPVPPPQATFGADKNSSF